MLAERVTLRYLLYQRTSYILELEILIQSITVPFTVTIHHNGSSCSVRATFRPSPPILPIHGADTPDEGESLLTDRRRLQRYHRGRRPRLQMQGQGDLAT